MSVHHRILRVAKLRAAVQELATFATTTRQDSTALQALDGLGVSLERECRRLAIQYRMQHKRAVARACKLALLCLDSLESCT